MKKTIKINFFQFLKFHNIKKSLSKLMVNKKINFKKKIFLYLLLISLCKIFNYFFLILK
jgi:hypothetical protein